MAKPLIQRACRQSVKYVLTYYAVAYAIGVFFGQYRPIILTAKNGPCQIRTLLAIELNGQNQKRHSSDFNFFYFKAIVPILDNPAKTAQTPADTILDRN